MKKAVLMAITILILAFTTGKMIFIAASPRLIAFSNSFDFVRASACTGLWQDYGPGDKLRGHIQSPVDRLVYDGDKIPHICTNSIDNLFPWIVTQFHSIGDVASLHQVGAVRCAFVLVALAALLWMARSWWHRFGVALIYSFIFGELGYLLLFNTMYSEFSVALGAFMLLSLLFLLCVQERRGAWPQIAFGVAGLLFFGLAKQSYGVFAPFFAAALGAVLVVRWRNFVPASGLVVIALAMPVVFVAMSADSYRVDGATRNANMTDSFLGEILPNATDKEAALDTLGLPRSCMKGIGMNWYTPSVQKEYPCPPLLQMSRAKLLPLLASQPIIFVRAMNDAIERARPFPHPSYHWFEDKADEQSIGFRIVKYTSPTTLYNALPLPAFRALALLSIVGTVVVGMLSAVRRSANWLDALFLTSGLLFFFSLGSAIFGDGKVDLPKHSFMWVIALTAQLVCPVSAITIGRTMAVISRRSSLSRRERQVAAPREQP